jgi:hypothetical protein
MSTKRKKTIHVLPNDVISSLEASDRKAAKLRKSLISTEALPKSFAAKSQVNIQTKLLESRILMQRAFSSLPLLLDAQKEKVEISREIEQTLDSIIAGLIDARRVLQKPTIEISNSSLPIIQHDSKEEIVGDCVESEYSQQRSEWIKTLNKHHANMYLQNQQNQNKFQVVDQSFWTQIESNVKHSSILDNSHTNRNGEYASSLGFDDTKLYQQILQEYILLSAQGEKGDSSTAAIERLSRSMKKKTRTDVDRRASKGRKIRYVVHEKLQNFTFPVSRPTGTLMDDDVLFRSMFGGAAVKR